MANKSASSMVESVFRPISEHVRRIYVVSLSSKMSLGRVEAASARIACFSEGEVITPPSLAANFRSNVRGRNAGPET